MKEIMDRMNMLEKKLEDMVVANNAIVSNIANNIELKIDLLLNADKNVSQQKAAASGKKVKAKNAFFKEKIKEDKNVYLNLLYSNEDVDKLMELNDVKSKKGDINKLSKMSEYLYKQITADATKLVKLNEIYEEYKKDLQNYVDEEADDDIIPPLED
jgi:hypothetical protein